MSDDAIYIKQLKTGNNLGAFKITADNYTTPTVSLLNPNDATPGYGVDITSFVVGSTQLDDTGLPANDVRMLFDKTTGAFRAGTATSTQWDNTLTNLNRGANSTALGLNNIASGANSFAAGSENLANGDKSVAIGLMNHVSSSAPESVSAAIGTLNTIFSNSTGSFAIGKSNYAHGPGNQSVLIGVSNESINGDNSVAIGEYNITSAMNATAIGQYCTASGANSVSIGYGDMSSVQNTAGSTGSIAIGHNNSSTGADSVAIGNNNTATGDYSICMGTGGNISSTGYSSVSIGTSSLWPNIVSGEDSIAIGGGCNLTGIGSFIWRSPNNANTAGAPCDTDNGSAHFVCGPGDGGSGGSSGKFRISFGTATGVTAVSSSTGYAWAHTSDINLKENLVEHNYSDTLDRIMDMPIYTYNFKTSAPGIKSIGPVAQDFNRLFPSDKDQLSIVERDMCGVALAAVKGVKLGLDSLSDNVNTRFASNSDATSALQSRIAVLELSLTTASTQIAAMEGRLAALKQ